MWNFSENVCLESLCWTRNINFEMPTINIHARCKVLAKETGLVILERQIHPSAGDHQWLTEHVSCKTGNLLTEPRHHGLACVTYLSHFSGSCGTLGLPHLPVWRALAVMETETLNAHGRVWWYWHMQNTVHSRSWDWISLSCSAFELAPWVWGGGSGGAWKKPDTFGSCHNFFGALELYLVQLSC